MIRLALAVLYYEALLTGRAITPVNKGCTMQAHPVAIRAKGPLASRVHVSACFVESAGMLAGSASLGQDM